jgi:hypothetical protein
MVPFVSAVLVLKTLPPVLVAYHWIIVPVAVRLATVPLLQKVCAALPVGAEGLPDCTKTGVLELLSHPKITCAA